MESKLKLFSLGIVVETKPPKVDIVMVCPIETLSIMPAGDIKNQSTKFEGNIKNVDNKNFKSEISSKNYLKAKWLPFGQSNRLSAPDVVANETVILFKFDDVDEYYWTPIFREVELRRLETVLYGFSNMKGGMSPFDKSTSYWLEVDTKNKSVQFHTAMNDGEYTEYDIIINTKAGTLTVKDKKNNYIHIDSKQDHITTNANKDITLISANTVNIKTGTLNIEAAVNLSGNMSMSGNMAMSGNMNVSGDVKASGSIIDSGGNTNHHSH